MSDLINTLRVLRAIYKEVYQLTRKSVFISVCVTDVLYGQTIRCICNISPVLCELSLKFVVDFVKVNNKSYHHWNRNKTTLAKVDRNCRFALNCNHQSSPCSFSAHHSPNYYNLSTTYLLFLDIFYWRLLHTKLMHTTIC